MDETPHLPIPATFVDALFGRASPEDLAAYERDSLIGFARDAWAALAIRRPDAPKIRYDSPAGQRVSVLEIVNDDMPFLLDSVLGELVERGIELKLVAHPIFTVERDGSGRLTGFNNGPKAGAQALRESVIHIHTDRMDDAGRRDEVVQGLEQVLAEVRLAVQDWRDILARVGALIADLKTNPPPLPVEEIGEAIQFLEWLGANNFTFLGVREYTLSKDGNTLEPDHETALGVMRSPDLHVLRRGYQLVTITPEIRVFLNEPQLLIVTKAAVRSKVHRRIYMDYVGVKRFDAEGNLVGEFRIVGLFTSTAYTRSTHSIPYLRRKVDAVIGAAGFDPNTHSGKALANVLDTYPRDELFQIDENTLFRFANAILQLEERPRVRVLARRDRFDRFVSVLVYVPRDRYSSDTRVAIGQYLATTYKGHVSAYYPFFPDGPLVRVHFIIGRREGATPDPDRETLERNVEALVRSWTDGFAHELETIYEPARARGLLAHYRDAFSDGFQDRYTPANAAADLRVMETLSAAKPLGVDFHPLVEEGHGTLGLKVWSYNRPIALSERVPVLENMGFRVVDERTHSIEPHYEGAPVVWFHDMTLETEGGAIDLDAAKLRLEAAFLVVMSGAAENDGFNALVLGAGLMWRDVALIRAIARYLRQIRIPYSQDYLWTTLQRHPGTAEKIVALFHARFDPHPKAGGADRATREAEIVAAIERALEAVDSLDEDRILRRFVNAVQSAIRTNLFQLDTDGQPKPLISIKYSSRKIDDLPLPRPLYEIFVYSPRVEGVHLRFAKVARGGIRWSDRPQDFRTEVLGLVKAQQVKNAVIVPVGAKGGFVPKFLPQILARKPVQREAVQAEGVAAYTLFIDALLDITDNIGADGKLIPPDDVVRHDDDDPYLVVAADKGTATFSDIANDIAIEHGFWLGDAFASGGSVGYDHKKMGITARGAWESVKRHFREMDIDISKTPFTVTGVGDMSGDVFGNGLLREKTTKLVAAFDHRDIFIDPNPNPEKSFTERQRLFDLPRSSWQDYDKALISQGGGVFPRSAKEIKLSPEAKALLGLENDTATPQQVMRAILMVPSDLLFFGGIGTYVRAAVESDEAVGDRANDPIRITGAELACKVIGEGANLGMTQRGRIEAAFKGVRLNTDAIDNSAGVNTSDVEVNLKIAFSKPVADGRLALEQRNAMLAEMTEDVGRLVLRNNYQQTLSISLAERRGTEDFGFQQRLIPTLEGRSLLDRAVEYLPDDKEIAERVRRGQSFTRPEIAVLLAYAKLSLNDDLVHSSVPDDPYLARELGRYFPSAISKAFPDAIEQHRLRREIIVTQLANSMINRGGPSLVVRISDQTGASEPEIAAAFAAARDSYGMTALNTAIEELDNEIASDVQLGMFRSVQNLLLDRLVWFLRNVDLKQGLASIVDHYRDGIAEVEAALDGGALSPEAAAGREARANDLVKAGVPEALARRLANLPGLTAAPDIVLVADRTKRKIADVATTYFAAESYFQLDQIARAADAIKVSDYFDRLALDRALDTIGEAERRIGAAMLAQGESGQKAVDSWIAANKEGVERVRHSVHNIAASGLTLSKLSVAASLLTDLVRD